MTCAGLPGGTLRLLHWRAKSPGLPVVYRRREGPILRGRRRRRGQGEKDKEEGGRGGGGVQIERKGEAVRGRERGSEREGT